MDDLKRAVTSEAARRVGTLAVVIAVAVVGYVWRRLRDGSDVAVATTEIAPEALL